jgi:hypothetical protein
MSLHASPSSEALARLHSQRRNSTITSIIIATLSLVLVGLLLGLLLLPPFLQQPQVTIIIPQPQKPTDPIKPPNFNPSHKPKPSSPASQTNPVLTSLDLSSISVPLVDAEIENPVPDFGDGDDFGDGTFGNGPDNSMGQVGLPPILRNRCSKQDRMARLLETGGTPQCEDAVVKGLDWLKSTQLPDGSWSRSQNPAAMTGLALLAYLGHCETPLSEIYGDNVLRAITYLVDLGMRQNGKLTTNPADKHWPYEHAIATYALAEATTFCRQLNLNIPNLNESTQLAGQLIIDNQHPSGGWDYSYTEAGDRGGDLSITAWQLQALKACKYTNLDFRNLQRTVNRSLDYVAKMQHSSGGFGYANASSPAGDTGYFTLTGAGMLSLQIWGRSSASPVRKGAKYLTKETRFDYNSEFSDLYGHYYEAQAMLNRGGEAWKQYNLLFRDSLLTGQNPDGSWKNPGNGQPLRAVGASFAGNSPMSLHYRTCLAILTLEVYYRFLPGTHKP